MAEQISQCKDHTERQGEADEIEMRPAEDPAEFQRGFALTNAMAHGESLILLGDSILLFLGLAKKVHDAALTMGHGLFDSRLPTPIREASGAGTRRDRRS